MKYTILINQYAAVNSGLELDLIDLSIFDFIKDFANSQTCVKIQTPEGFFFWISHKLIIDGMPLLKIKTSQGIIKRIDNLINAGVLVKHPDCERYSKTLYSFGKNYDLLMFKNADIFDFEQKLHPHNESLGRPSTFVSPPLNESLGNNNIIDNSINDNTITGDSSLFPDIDREVENKKKEKEAAKKRTSIFANSDVYALVDFSINPPDYSKFEAMFDAEKYAPVDLVFYFNSVKDWSDVKGNKELRTKAGWLATVRIFISKDLERNKLRLKPEFAQSNSGINVASALSYLKNDY